VAVILWASSHLESRIFAQAGNPAPPPLAWDAMNKDYKAKPGETTNMFTFSATNVSKRLVYLEKLTPSCGCTVATLPAQPWLLTPGSNGDVRITINFAGKSGLVTKFIRVDAYQKESPESLETNKFEQTLIIKVSIPAPLELTSRSNNVEVAKADRQAVFKSGCAACHAAPALGKSGEELFRAACSICHESPHRASMVPDLAKLSKATDDSYWRSWISFGKEGTLMPGFLNSGYAGGPLTPEQVKSLVLYLGDKHRSQTATTQVGGASQK
jgi:mono/diheme cytochrome c family protein